MHGIPYAVEDPHSDDFQLSAAALVPDNTRHLMVANSNRCVRTQGLPRPRCLGSATALYQTKACCWLVLSCGEVYCSAGKAVPTCES